MEDLERRAWVCQAVVLPITAWEDAEWECEEVAAEGAVVVGHGDGDAVSLPLLERQWSSLLLPTESRSSTTLRERERHKEEEKKVVGSGVVCCRVLSARP